MLAKRAEGGSPVSAFALTMGALAAPGAWLAQTTIGETIVAQWCFPHDVQLRIPLGSRVAWSVVGMSAMWLLVGLVGTWLAWRNWRLLHHARKVRPESTDTKVEGEAFVARVALMASGLFLFALVATDVATSLVSACR
ncbi:hypothetical protein C0Z18_27890 [Trinickia dabaoshanensis]|uniref:Uncharacterized protein n=1 Tax=Trinickia dabaoshanensis TaxID=564714 RepID=A0A2N7VDS5_9BURK|nr:hypothetical protein [Trinickia dabaoshanensis]PMS15306.1 hypothetical protein C0Z18_27890 [Trinickia dabaoshanensis]